MVRCRSGGEAQDRSLADCGSQRRQRGNLCARCFSWSRKIKAVSTCGHDILPHMPQAFDPSKDLRMVQDAFDQANEGRELSMVPDKLTRFEFMEALLRLGATKFSRGTHDTAVACLNSRMYTPPVSPHRQVLPGCSSSGRTSRLWGCPDLKQHTQACATAYPMHAAC